eukprot:TRINITY_DN75813_c0_g1_i1.p1 TRINITY_DN75813_c0_g1~~TRINITY_DN75813_c0_g1_i1.p1  ORF type:complete len:269 (+),score=54.13 TRINITY_DN75813_c0_g1_i1:135-941(+)
MELHVVSSEGIPEGCVLSVRAGSTRRQAPISAERPFRFPATASEALPFKVDVLEPIASARLILRPGEEQRTDCQYTIPLESVAAAAAENNAGIVEEKDAAKDVAAVAAEAAEMSVTIAVSPMKDGKQDGSKDDVGDASRPGSSAAKGKQPSAGSSASSRHGQASAAREYLDKHNLVEFTQLLVQSVIKEQPDKPYAFMARQFYFPDPQPRQPRPNTTSAAPGGVPASGAPSPTPPPSTPLLDGRRPISQEAMKTQATVGVGNGTLGRS